MNGPKATPPIRRHLLLITVVFYSMLPWGLGQPLKKNCISFATYLFEVCLFCENWGGFLLLLLSHSLLVLKCEINKCLSLLLYCCKSCFTLCIPDSILTFCRRTLPRV